MIAVCQQQVAVNIEHDHWHCFIEMLGVVPHPFRIKVRSGALDGFLGEYGYREIDDWHEVSLRHGTGGAPPGSTKRCVRSISVTFGSVSSAP